MLNPIISDLLTNAIKFTNETLMRSVSGTEREILIADQAKVFSPFTQINYPNFSEQRIGLGLTISNELVRLMNGTISINSCINQ